MGGSGANHHGGNVTADQSATEVAAVGQLGRPVLVMVSRDGSGWRAEIAALGVVPTAGRLDALDRQIRQLLGDDFVDYQFHTGDAELDRLVTQIRAARLAARRYDERARRLTELVLMPPSGGSVRNLAVLVGLSYQRVHQLMRKQLSTPEIAAVRQERPSR
jgi:hypothetical protein